ncbi:hypothetical protein DOT_5122 [Desulfosporosinus sp. OT]|nr:hypothetical protein DOT_5122 [Desulfosporosinus sp. OT]
MAIFLLDRPEQTACLVQVHIVRPAVEGGKTLGNRSPHRRVRRPYGMYLRYATPSE